MRRFLLVPCGTAFAIFAASCAALRADDAQVSTPAAVAETGETSVSVVTPAASEESSAADTAVPGEASAPGDSSAASRFDQAIEEPTDPLTAPVEGSAAAPEVEPSVEVVSETGDIAAPQVAADAPQEVIKERFANRAVKVERHVVQDAAGNYVNQGLWTMWDERGRIVARGEFQRGQREGTWTRWYAPGEGEMFTKSPYYKQFEAPFTAEVGQKHNELHGDWTVYDAKHRKITQWAFENGERHGRSVWYFTNGRKLRECNYVHGELDGEVLEWKADGKPALKETYQLGRQVGHKTDRHSPKLVKSEGEYLFARDLATPSYDWWRGVASITVKGKDGKDVRHGAYTSWHKNGQKLMEGRYEEGQPVGSFTWWHPNGQQSVVGSYEHGRPIGEWTWWHANGQKSIAGGFVDGSETGRWMWWKEDGKLANVAEYSDHSEAVVSSTPAEIPAMVGESDEPPVAKVKTAATSKSPRSRKSGTAARKPANSGRRVR